MSVKHINRSNFEQEVLKSDKPVLLDFWASWCGPCKMLSPIVEQLANEVEEVKVCKINIDEEEDLAKQFRVMSIPTLVFMKDGKIVNSSIGLQGKGGILKMMEL